MQRERGKEIKSVKQISEDIRRAKHQFEQMLAALSVPNITLEEDLTKRTPTIETVLKDLPSEHRLKEMMEHPYAETPEIRQRILSGYKGKYEIIRRAAENIKNLKCQAEKIYYLAAELNLYKIRNEFDPQHPEGITLKSYEVYSNQNLRLPRYEKNMLNPHYLRQLREQQLQNGGSGSQQFLSYGQPIITLSLYDSINGEKTYEYNCHGEQTLLQAASKFYCMVARLQGRETSHWANSYCLIQDNFYYHGTVARKKIQEIISFSSQMEDDDERVKSEYPYTWYEMGKTKMKNLRVVFGRPYLFRHLEGCDHIIIFKDLHNLTQGSNAEPLRKDKYPLIAFEGRMRKRKCDGCRAKYAELVSLNDPLKAGKHVYLCKQCHSNLHWQEKEEHTCVRYIHD